MSLESVVFTKTIADIPRRNSLNPTDTANSNELMVMTKGPYAQMVGESLHESQSNVLNWKKEINPKIEAPTLKFSLGVLARNKITNKVIRIIMVGIAAFSIEATVPMVTTHMNFTIGARR
jgi:hypothetical protein